MLENLLPISLLSIFIILIIIAVIIIIKKDNYKAMVCIPILVFIGTILIIKLLSILIPDLDNAFANASVAIMDFFDSIPPAFIACLGILIMGGGFIIVNKLRKNINKKKEV